jgi:very-short-patch-repair endonuclease
MGNRGLDGGTMPEKRMKWSHSVIISEIKKFKSVHERVSYKLVKNLYPSLYRASVRYFESFRNALISSGLSPDEEKEPMEGDNNPFYGKSHSEESKNKMSTYRKESGASSGEKNPMFGKEHSVKSKVEMSEKSKNFHKDNPDFQRGTNNHMFGKSQTNESNIKRSKSLKEYNSKFEKRPYNLTEEGLNRIREGRAKAIANQKSSMTDIEVIMIGILDDIGVNYEFQHAFKYFCADFFLQDYNCVVWCDGDYWHGNVDTGTITDRQKTQIRLDKSHNGYLNKRGIKYLRFWGSDIKKNINTVKEEILKLKNREI